MSRGAGRPTSARGAVVTVRFQGANPAPTIDGLDQQSGKVNYFIGRDPAKWHANVPTFGGVVYRGLYPGVDLHVYGRAGHQPEYDWVVHRGADAGRIRLQVEGSSGVSVTRSGGIGITTSLGPVEFTAPTAYQLVGNLTARRAVAAAFSRASDGSLGLTVGAYDHGRDLIIDPTIVYSAFVGSASGTGADYPNGIATDRTGAVYLAGDTLSYDFTTTSGAFQPNPSPRIGFEYDAFVLKLNNSGSRLIYATYLGGSQNDHALGIAVNPAGAAYVVGYTQSSDFPLANALQSTFSSQSSFICALTADGSHLVFSTYWGIGTGADGVALDGTGNIYVTGSGTPGSFVNPIMTTGGTYVTELNPTGTSVQFSTSFGGSNIDGPNGIAVDSSGMVYITGLTNSTDFPTTPTAPQPTWPGGTLNPGHAFVAKLDSVHSKTVWSTYLGGSTGRWGEEGNAVAVDQSGNAYVTGYTNATDFPTVHPVQSAAGGGEDAFVTEVAAAGTSYVFSTYLGGSSSDRGYGIAVDPVGGVYVTGRTASTNFPVSNAIQSTSGGQDDVFLTRLAPGGTSITYSTYIGGTKDDDAYAVALDAWANVYVTGSTDSANYPVVGGTGSAASQGTGEWVGFVTKVKTLGPQAPPLGGAPTAQEGMSFCYSCWRRALQVMGLAGDPVDTEFGTLTETVADVDIPARGTNLAFTRSYNSTLAGTSGLLGSGWTFNAGASLSQNAQTGTVTVTEENGSQVAFLRQGTGYVPSAPRLIATLTQDSTSGNWTLTRQAREKLVFSSAGKVLSDGDLNGYTTTYTYSAGLLTTITDSSGLRSLTLGYTGSLLTSVTDPIGRVVRFSYNDGAGNLTDVTDVNGGVTHYSYDANHRLLTTTDPRAGQLLPAGVAEIVNQYDTSGRVVAQAVRVVPTDRTKDRTTTFQYTGDPTSSAGGTTLVTDPKGNATLSQYISGLRMAVTQGYGTSSAATTRYTYDPTTLGVMSTTDPNGHTAEMSYDASGNLIAQIDGLGRGTVNAYDALNDVTAVTDPKGVTTTMTYDGNGNLLTKSTPLVGSSPTQSATTTNAYGDSTHPGDRTGMTDPDGKVWHYAYDTYGDPTSVTDPLGDQATNAYNTVGWVASRVSPKGNVSGCNCAAQYTTTDSYVDPQTGVVDEFGDVRTVTDPLGHVTTRSYDAERNLVGATDPDGHTTQYRYDLANERTDTIRADGSDLHTDYFPDGTVQDQVDAAGNTTTYAYDALGRETSQITPVTTACPSGCTTTYTYDGAGNRLTMVDPLMQTTTSAYDAANGLTSITYSDGKTPNVTGIAYDSDGRRTTMTDGTGSSHWVYDSLGRMTSYQNGAGATVQYGYDLKGQLTAITYPNGKVVSRGYDDAGSFTSVTDWLGHTTTFTPDPNANVVTESYPNTVSASLGYNTADQLTGITDSSTSGGTLASFAYQRDADGQVTSEADGGQLAATRSYAYTPLNQLGSVNSGAYAYDAADNLTRQPSDESQAFDAADELTATRSPISLIGTASGGDGGTSPAVTLTLPAGAAAGDQVILASTQAASNTVETPPGYTQVGSATSGGSAPGETIVWRHTVLPGDTAVVIPYGGLFPKAAVLAVYRGVDITTPVEAQSSGANPGGTTLTDPGVTTTTPADTLLMISGATGNATAAAWTPATGMTSEAAMGTIPLVSSSLADQGLTAAGATGSRTATFATSAQLAGLFLALRPATAATYTDDPRGNRTAVTPPGAVAATATTFSYDQADRLTAYSSSPTLSATYSYDGDGLRMGKSVTASGPPVSTAYAWDESGGLPQLLSDSATTYIDGPLGPVEQISSSGAVDYYSADQLGSTRMLTDATGAVAATFTYDAFGALTASTGTAATPLQWAGLVRDSESGLLYARARYYDPTTGQFLSRDPLEAQTHSPYAYVTDNPLNSTDPSGMNSTSMSPDSQHCDMGGDQWVYCGNNDVHGANRDIWAPHDLGAAISNVYQHTVVGVGGCIIICFNLTFQGGHFSLNGGAMGLALFGPLVGWANLPASQRHDTSVMGGAGYGAGVAGSEGVSCLNAAIGPEWDPSDWELDAWLGTGFWVGAQHSIFGFDLP